MSLWYIPHCGGMLCNPLRLTWVSCLHTSTSYLMDYHYDNIIINAKNMIFLSECTDEIFLLWNFKFLTDWCMSMCHWLEVWKSEQNSIGIYPYTPVRVYLNTMWLIIMFVFYFQVLIPLSLLGCVIRCHVLISRTCRKCIFGVTSWSVVVLHGIASTTIADVAMFILVWPKVRNIHCL